MLQALLRPRKPGEPPRVIAHRGGSALAPENTLPAIRIAKRLRVDGIEIDVRGGRRGELLVIHDATLNRTTDVWGRVEEASRAELRRADAGRKFNRRFHRVRIPTLRQALALARPTPLIIEVKEGEQVERVAAEMMRSKAWGHAALMSFDAFAVARARGKFPRLVMGHLVKLGWRGRWGGTPRAVVREAEGLGAAFICVDAQGCGSRLVQEAHRKGLPVWVWTVDRAPEADRLVEAGADALITNQPVTIMVRMAQWSEWLHHD